MPFHGHRERRGLSKRYSYLTDSGGKYRFPSRLTVLGD
jgi:hypothetical protein